MCWIVLASRMALAALSWVVSTCICRHTPMSFRVRVTGVILKVVLAACNAIKSHAITTCNAITAPSLRDDHMCMCCSWTGSESVDALLEAGARPQQGVFLEHVDMHSQRRVKGISCLGLQCGSRHSAGHMQVRCARIIALMGKNVTEVLEAWLPPSLRANRTSSFRYNCRCLSFFPICMETA